MKNQTLLQTLALGVISGMRSSLGPAFSCLYAGKRSKNKLSRLNFMGKSNTGKVLGVMAVGELIVDKLPGIGNRTAAAGVIGRGLAGALAGATLYECQGKQSWKGAAIGAAAAIVATYAFFHLRQTAVRKGKMNDRVVALAEDTLAIGIGSLATRLK
ncbi:DUF4126 family protein [Chitinophaga sp. sic0106]|uniref:DUF4126 family protein n=1 Tax=Chitinophaga sp. sic0106 TaxID=2854785 RepID=UPI001C479C45|nr:DUF4126 family protein [Chitinophaga sp. sic0106]MBV7532099.1 DUF4126 family protein [Chitinophaga sp. sic0106]